jgi:hypothetical protein
MLREQRKPVRLTSEWSGFARVDYSHIGESWSANNAQVNPLKRPAYDIAGARLGVRSERYEFVASSRTSPTSMQTSEMPS